jgi:signal transduction histidine kinase
MVLILATDGETRGRVHQRLEEEFEVELVKSYEQATARLREQRFALLLVDWREGGRSAEELAAELRAFDAEMSVMILGAGRGVKVIAEQCLQVPFDSQDLVALTHHEVQISMRRRGRSAAIREMEGVIGLLRRELEVRDSMAGYGEASASMVHDLQNALFSTLGYTARLIHETAQLKDAVGDQAKPIDMIAKKLEHTSNYLLHLAQTCRYRDGNVMGHERLDLQAEIEHVRSVLFFNSPHLQVVAPRTGEAGSRAEGTAVAVVRGDRYELHRVFQNLFKNAFEAAAEEVRVTLAVVDGQVRVEVADDGRGFAEGEEKTALFQSPRSSKRGGQGLGLRICHQIIRRHGGDITLRSEPGRGAVITVSLPLCAEV